jgi:hypothetical protein
MLNPDKVTVKIIGCGQFMQIGTVVLRVDKSISFELYKAHPSDGNCYSGMYSVKAACVGGRYPCTYYWWFGETTVESVLTERYGQEALRLLDRIIAAIELLGDVEEEPNDAQI